MDRFEIEDTLKTFRIIADTREHNTDRAAARFAALGAGMERGTLDYGDYCANITLPNGRNIYDISDSRIYPSCSVERKMSLDELAGCFTRSRERFEREFQRATDHKAKVFLLVECASYEQIFRHNYRSRFRPKSYIASLCAWVVRYNLTPVFCEPGTSAKLIREFLYRDIKERLEKGEYG